MKKIYTFFTALLIFATAYGQAPDQFNYQAVLRDASGNLKANTSANIEISILQGSTTGIAVYTETHAATTNTFGLVNLLIGGGTATLGSFASINWATGPYFVKISIDGTDFGTSQLISVPYAKYAEKAGNVVTLTGDQTIAGNKTFSNTVTVPAPVNTTDAVNKTYVDTKASGLWGITGNVGTTASNFIGTTDAQPLKFAVDSTEKLRLTTHGTLEFWNTGRSVFIGEGVGAADDLSNNYNVFIGYNCGTANTTGSDNVATGSFALGSNTTGNDNVVSGYDALYSNTTGNGNVATGFFALNSNTTGHDNIASGYNTLRMNTTGYSNIASGYNALHLNTKGFGNVASGYLALGSNTTGNDNVASGYNALGSNTTGNANVALGGSALASDTTGNYCVAIGYNALIINRSGSNNTAIGFGADVSAGDLTNATALGYNAKVNASNKIVLGNASATTVGGYGAWTNYSDRRLKENIVYKNNLGLDFILKLKTVSYNYKADENKRRRDGLIAQDVEQAMKDLGLEFSGLVIDDDKDKTMNLSYGEFVIPLINAVQAQQKEIELLKKQNEELLKLIRTLKNK